MDEMTILEQKDIEIELLKKALKDIIDVYKTAERIDKENIKMQERYIRNLEEEVLILRKITTG